jgi:DNA mismatch repair protein MLH3
MQTHEIESLDVETRTRLRSTQILTSLPQIISELLQNSLDAGARQVEAGIDCEQWSCYVRDDGVGISKDDLSALGKGPDQARYCELPIVRS